MTATKAKLVLAVDLDGVCADFYGRMRQIAAEWFECEVEALPTEVARIHLAKGEQIVYGHDFDRIKLQYYLLPHNIHNFYSSPKWQHVDQGDYVLYLNPVEQPPYDADQGKLAIEGDEFIDAELVHQHARGRLYRIGTGGDR